MFFRWREGGEDGVTSCTRQALCGEASVRTDGLTASLSACAECVRLEGRRKAPDAPAEETQEREQGRKMARLCSQNTNPKNLPGT